MAQTTTHVNACDVVIQLDNASGTLTNISGSSNQASMDLTRAIGEAFTFDGDYSLKMSCKKSISFSLQCVYTLTETEALNILMDWFINGTGSRTLQIDVPDSTVGSDRYSCEVVLESLSVPLTADDAAPVLVSASLSNDGTVTRTTISS